MDAEGIGIVLISHGDYAQGSLKSAEMIMGRQKRVKVVSVIEGMGLEEAKEKLNKAIDEVKNNYKTLIMTDIVGGTPSNAACIIGATRDDIVVIAGFNMPMLLEALARRNEDEDKIIEDLCNIGKSNIINLTNRIKNSFKVGNGGFLNAN